MFLRNASIGLIAAALAACSQDAADDSVDDGSQNATESTYELFFTNPIPQMLAAGTVTDRAKDANRHGIMHNKFTVVNGKDVWSGSWNYSTHDEQLFWNNGIVMHSPDAAKKYTASFEAMWARFGADGSVGPQKFKQTDHAFKLGQTTANVYFPSGDKATTAIADALSKAEKTIHILAFEFSNGPMADVVV